MMSSHSGVENASSAGLSSAPMNSNLSLISTKFQGGWQWRSVGLGTAGSGAHFQAADGGGGFAPPFLDVVNAAGDRSAFRAIKQCGVLGYPALLIGFEAGGVESAPAKRGAGFDDF